MILLYYKFPKGDNRFYLSAFGGVKPDTVRVMLEGYGVWPRAVNIRRGTGKNLFEAMRLLDDNV